MKFEGHYDDYSLDSAELKSDTDLLSNRRGIEFTKAELDEHGQTVEKKYYRYQLMLPINHGLAKSNQLLPAGVHTRITFHRAYARKGVIDISDKVSQYPSTKVTILDPVLNACWATSRKLNTDMSQVATSGLQVPFESYCIRHRVLDDGLNEYNIQISQGSLPKYIVFFLMEPFRYNNDFKYSSSRMSPHSLKEFSVLLDNEVMQHYPLKMDQYGGSIFSHQFYRRFLIMSGRYGDSSDELLDEDTFKRDNFLVLETFSDFENREGHLTVKLRFNEPLENKLFLCWMPVTEKFLNFDRHMNVTVT